VQTTAGTILEIVPAVRVSGPARTVGRSSLDAVDEPTTCDFCGRQGSGAETLTWTTSVEGGRRRTYCEECSRTHLRAIEGKLDNEWW
jgi:hypothetical protein